jgi:hypothetical protein
MALMLFAAAVLGWAASRLVIPTPSVAYVSPRVLATEPAARYFVRVPFAENARWVVQGGENAWCDTRRGWISRKPWLAGPGDVMCPPSKDGVRLVVEGFGRESGIAGAVVTVVSQTGGGER